MVPNDALQYSKGPLRESANKVDSRESFLGCLENGEQDGKERIPKCATTEPRPIYGLYRRHGILWTEVGDIGADAGPTRRVDVVKIVLIYNHLLDFPILSEVLRSAEDLQKSEAKSGVSLCNLMNRRGETTNVERSCCKQKRKRRRRRIPECAHLPLPWQRKGRGW